MEYVTQKSEQEMYARLEVEDSMYFNQIARTKFTRQAMKEKNFIEHSSPTTIRSIVSAIEELKKLKSNGNRMMVIFND